jgi:hypothetical protein
MTLAAIQELALRLERSDPGDGREQRELFEKLRELRSIPELDGERARCLEAASMLVSYLARMGALSGEDVLPIAVRLLRSAAAPLAALPSSNARARAAASTPSPVELVGDMLLGQILLRRGYVTEEGIQQALELQRSQDVLFGDALIQIGAATWEQVVEGLSYQDACRRIRENFVDPTGKRPPSPALLARPDSLKLVGEVLLGELLIERGTITRKQLERALEVQRATGARIGEALVRSGAVTWEQIESGLRIQAQLRRRA